MKEPEKHGYATRLDKDKLSIYQIWSGIKQRCFNTSSQAYKIYGARGISMSEDWKESFEAFLRDMGPKPFKDASIDRIDNSKGYSKDNCRWADRKQQAQNTKFNVNITFGSATRALSYWCEFFGMAHATALGRIRKEGMSPQEALTTPLKHKTVKVGDIFGSLTVVSLGDYKPWKCMNKHREVMCVCSCGRTHKAVDTRLKFGSTTRCQSCTARLRSRKRWC